ncbi:MULTISPECIES: hypothetical protein [unclassified Bradyrhizobium]|uniref:hypothetical protein n=1 Tax=unclassified Bradyrhizobium TaxID=2631580 RepID=UPI0029168457|nr:MULTISPECIES: hypothetical protein [unclassified Bradyrhizobium]
MSTDQCEAFLQIWRTLWRPARSAPARIIADRSVISLEIRKSALQQLAPLEPAAAALLQAFEGADHGDWGGPEYPTVLIEFTQLPPLLRMLLLTC